MDFAAADSDDRSSKEHLAGVGAMKGWKVVHTLVQLQEMNAWMT
jgi:hypothetical protein